MKIHHLIVGGAVARLKSELCGLSDAEAQRRLAEFGANEVEEAAHAALLFTFTREFGYFFAIILWVAAALAFSSPNGASPGKAGQRQGSRSWA